MLMSVNRVGQGQCLSMDLESTESNQGQQCLSMEADCQKIILFQRLEAANLPPNYDRQMVQPFQKVCKKRTRSQDFNLRQFKTFADGVIFLKNLFLYV